jgi:hypothetical protein
MHVWFLSLELWSGHLYYVHRCLIKEGRSIDYQVQSPESLGNALVDKFVRPAIEVWWGKNTHFPKFQIPIVFFSYQCTSWSAMMLLWSRVECNGVGLRNGLISSEFWFPERLWCESSMGCWVREREGERESSLHQTRALWWYGLG